MVLAHGAFGIGALHYLDGIDMNLARPLALLAALATGLTLASCTSPAATPSASPSSTPATLAVVASTDVWGDLAAKVGGDRVNVTSIIDDPSKDPHEYEANAQIQLTLSKAQVVIENGGGYDDFVDTMLAAAKNPAIERINAVTVSGKQASAGDELNEHVWYDFGTVTKVVDAISATYTKLDPSDAATFSANASTLKASLASLTQKENDLKATYAGQPVSITEPVPLYMLEAIGLENKTPEEFSEAVENESDVAPAVLNETLKLYSDHAVKLLAYNEQTTGAQTDAVVKAATANNIPVVAFTETLPAGKTYVSWMTDNLDALAAALAQ